MTLTAQHIAQLPADQVAALFRRGEVGQIPDGEADGSVIVWPGSPATAWIDKLVQSIAWQGHVVNARTRELENRILPLGLRAIRADVYTGCSWFDGADCIVVDYSKRSLFARFVRDEIRRVGPGLYLGLVYFGRLRSIYFTLQFTV
ncbi:MAG TPA: hypothetical protein VJR89_34550 [Polyangiales bacterium]|nr:hypothetical protein [Polyangiales bacterium]